MPPKDDTKKAAVDETTEIRALQRKGQPGMGATSGGPLGDRMVRGGEIVREDELPAEKFEALAKDQGFTLIKVAKALLVTLALAVMSLAPVTAVADGTHFTYDAKIGWGGSYLNTLPTVFGGIDTAFTGVKGAMHSPVADIAALKAIPATGATARTDKQLCYVESGPGGAKVMYAFDAQSSEAGDDDLVVQPVSGTGRWIKVFDATDGASYAVLASTDNGEGASLIGIDDVGTYFGAATNVEAALQLIGPTMTDDRDPNAHASSHATAGGDPIAPADIGAMAVGDAPTAHAISHSTGGGDDIAPGDIGAAAATDLDALEAKTAPYLLPVLAAWDPTDIGAGVVDPPTQVDGDRYLCSASESPYVANRIYTYNDGTSTWGYETPAAGYVSYNVDTSAAIVFDGSAWGALGGSGVPDLTATGTEINAVADVSAAGAVSRWVKLTMTNKTAGEHAFGGQTGVLPAAFFIEGLILIVDEPEATGTATVNIGTDTSDGGDADELAVALSVATGGPAIPGAVVSIGVSETYISGSTRGDGWATVVTGSDSAGDHGLYIETMAFADKALTYTVPAGDWTEFAGYVLIKIVEIDFGT